MTAKPARVFLWGGLGVLLLASLVYMLWPQPVPVDLGEVHRGALRVTVDEEGHTRVRDVYLVSAPLTGRLQRIDQEAGDPVVAGETVLARIRPVAPTLLDQRTQAEAVAVVGAAEAALALAEAELERARAELEFAESELHRARTLAARGNLSQRGLDQAELAAKTRRAAVATTEAALKVKSFELETARASLILPGGGNGTVETESCCINVLAPVDGQILRLIQESEAVVFAGAPLVELGDANDLEIVVDLLSSDAVRIAADAEVDIEGWGGRTLEGHVRRVEPYGFTKISSLGIEEQRVNVIVDFDAPPDHWLMLGHGFRVELRITVWQGDDVLVLPISALFREGETWSVFVESDGRASKRQVEIGHRNDREAEVLDGLVAGERVVLHPSDRVGDGLRIEARVLENP
jgi:HlyD family secretion protein